MDKNGHTPSLRKARLQARWTRRVSLNDANHRHTFSHQKRDKSSSLASRNLARMLFYFHFAFFMETNRHRGDSSPCGQRPMDFESISLATRTQCLVTQLRINESMATNMRSSRIFCLHNVQAQMTRKLSRAVGVVVSHPLSMREALGSIPRPSIHIRLS